MHLAYEPSAEAAPQSGLADIRANLMAALCARRDDERRLRTALVGPHRDELRVQIDSLPARTHGSRGEWRTAAIAVKLAVYELLRNQRGVPVLLLDEVFAELDPVRTEALIDAFGDFGQLFVTTAGEPPEPLRQSGRSFRVEDGTVQEMREM